MKTIDIKKYFKWFLLILIFASCEDDVVDLSEANENAAERSGIGVVLSSDTNPELDKGGLLPRPSALVGQEVKIFTTVDLNLLKGQEWSVDTGLPGQKFETFTEITDTLKYTFKTVNDEKSERERNGFLVKLREFYKDGTITTKEVKVPVRDSIIAKVNVPSRQVTKGRDVIYSLPPFTELGFLQEDTSGEKVQITYDFGSANITTPTDQIKNGIITRSNFSDLKVKFVDSGEFPVKVTISRAFPAKSSDIVTIDMKVVDNELISFNNLSLLDRKRLFIGFDQSLESLPDDFSDAFNYTYNFNGETNVDLPIESVTLATFNDVPNAGIIINFANEFPRESDNHKVTYTGTLNTADNTATVAEFFDKDVFNYFFNRFRNTLHDYETGATGTTIGFNIAPGQPLGAGGSITYSDEEIRPGTDGKQSLKLVSGSATGPIFARQWVSPASVEPGDYKVTYWAKASRVSNLNNFVRYPGLEPFGALSFSFNITTEWQQYEGEVFTINKPQDITVLMQFGNAEGESYTMFVDDFELLRVR